MALYGRLFSLVGPPQFLRPNFLIPIWTYNRDSTVYVVQGDYDGRVSSGLIHSENGRRFLTPHVCADSLLTG